MSINGSWRGWLLGIVATLIASLIGSGILFQRETREQLAQQKEQLRNIEIRGLATLHNVEQRIERLERHVDELEKKNAK